MSFVPSGPRIERLDWFLQEFVTLANQGTLSIPVILATGGFLVSGNLTSGREYFEGFGQELSEGMEGADDEVKESWRSFFSTLADDVYGFDGSNQRAQDADQPADEDQADPDFHYLHLRDARIFHPGGDPIPSNRAIYWRTRLEAVDGFCLGSLGRPATSPSDG